VFSGGSYPHGRCLTCREAFAQQGPAQREQLTTPTIGQESEVADAREAKQTAATVTFIKDAALLEPAGGVAAFLRWRA
jgi:peptide subunit release factor 1 (eRF1)